MDRRRISRVVRRVSTRFRAILQGSVMPHVTCTKDISDDA